MSEQVPVVRTPDDNFTGLADYPFAPHYLDLDGVRMHYLDEGPADGPVALMVHGMPTWSYLYRHMIPPMVAAGYRCIAPDHIGFGRSDKVTEASWYDIARHTANLRRLIEQLDLHRITLCCQDWGGPIGLAQAAEMPERFERLVIMNTWLHHDGYEYTPGILDWIERNRPGGMLRENIPSRIGWGHLLVMATGRATPAEVIGPLLTGGEPVSFTGETEQVRAAYSAPFDGLGDEGSIGPRQFPLSIPVHDHARGNADAQARHFAAICAMDIPAHFIWGLVDRVFTGEWGQQWCGLMQRATWDAFDDANHFLQDTHGARIAQLVIDYARADR